MSRRRTKHAEKADARVYPYFPAALLAQVDAFATRERRSLSNAIVHLVEIGLGAHAAPQRTAPAA